MTDTLVTMTELAPWVSAPAAEFDIELANLTAGLESLPTNDVNLSDAAQVLSLLAQGYFSGTTSRSDVVNWLRTSSKLMLAGRWQSQDQEVLRQGRRFAEHVDTSFFKKGVIDNREAAGLSSQNRSSRSEGIRAANASQGSTRQFASGEPAVQRFWDDALVQNLFQSQDWGVRKTAVENYMASAGTLSLEEAAQIAPVLRTFFNAPLRHLRLYAFKAYGTLANQLSSEELSQGAAALREKFKPEEEYTSSTQEDQGYDAHVTSTGSTKYYYEAIKAYMALAGRLTTEEVAEGARVLRSLFSHGVAADAYMALIDRLTPEEVAQGAQALREKFTHFAPDAVFNAYASLAGRLTAEEVHRGQYALLHCFEKKSAVMAFISLAGKLTTEEMAQGAWYFLNDLHRREGTDFSATQLTLDEAIEALRLELKYRWYDSDETKVAFYLALIARAAPERVAQEAAALKDMIPEHDPIRSTGPYQAYIRMAASLFTETDIARELDIARAQILQYDYSRDRAKALAIYETLLKKATEQQLQREIGLLKPFVSDEHAPSGYREAIVKFYFKAVAELSSRAR